MIADIISLDNAVSRDLLKTFCDSEIDPAHIVETDAALQEHVMRCYVLSKVSGHSFPGMEALLQSREVLGSILMAGSCKDWPTAMKVLCRLAASDSAETRGLPLKLAVATAIVQADDESDHNFHQEPIDLTQRYRVFCEWAKKGELFDEFAELSAWHLRHVLGSWHSDDDLQWARQHVETQYKRPDAVGEACKMVRYIDRNYKGVSVQDGLRFYDGQIASMPIIYQYGGVCGAVSKFGTSMCQAFGVPAMPVGQPGHCAHIWRGPGGNWQLSNDNSGWNESKMHDKIQRSMDEVLGPWREEAGLIPVMDRALSSTDKFLVSQQLRIVSHIRSFVPVKQLQCLVRAVQNCPFNLAAWEELMKLASSLCKDGEMEDEYARSCMCFPWARLVENNAHSAQDLKTQAEIQSIFKAAAVAAERAAESLGGPWAGGARNLSLLQPVCASADCDLAANVVDGSDSEWFPSDAGDPQWLIIDLGQLCQIQTVSVKWWGDYGSRNSLSVWSADVCSSAKDTSTFKLQGKRESDAEFNGWTYISGWKQACRYIRLQLGNPCPDCFGLGKSYGIRQVTVLGRRLKQGEAPSDLLLRWAEACFADVQDLASQQALRFVRSRLQELQLR